MDPLKVSHIKISNILGIRSLEFQPGKITSIEGPNGVGKTSVLKAIKAAVSGGHDATLIRKGKPKGEVVIEFANGMVLTKEIKDSGSTVTLHDRGGVKIPKAASKLKGIVDQVGLNPVRLLTASQKERVSILLESVPMEIPKSELEKAAGVEVPRDDERHPLEIVDSVRQTIFDRRTRENRDAKSKKAVVAEMRGSLPEVDQGRDYGKQREELEAKRDAIRAEAQEKIDGVKVSVEERLGKNREYMEQKIQSLRDDFEKLRSDLTAEKDAKIESIQKNTSEELEELSAGIEVALEREKVQEKAKSTLEYIEKMEKGIHVLEALSERLTQKIQAVDAIKAKMLENFPIAGLEVKDGDIFLHGIPFDQTNEAERIRFCLTVAGLRQTDLPLVCVDGLESLDHERFALFCEEAKKTGMQFFVTRVSDQEDMHLQAVD